MGLQMKPKTSGRRRDGLHHIDAEVGRRIREARLAKGLTQGQLGERMDLTFQQIQKYEKGLNSVATCRLPSLCKALDMPIINLVTGLDGKQRQRA
jgi:transcriptional regulator with XRE-family HTH domain